MKKSIGSLIILLFWLSGAFAASSANYHISAEVIDMGGGSSESTNYQLLGKVRPYKPLISTSTNFIIKGGFVNAAYLGITPEGYPQIYSVTPNYGINDRVATLEILGIAFSSEATISLEGFSSTIVAANVIITGSEEIDCEFDLTGRTAGIWSLIITNPGPKASSVNFEVRNPGPPGLLEPATNTPNPFDPNLGPTVITFKMSSAAQVSLYLFNQSGEMVWQRTVSATAGDNTVNWNGISGFAEGVPTGVYLCKIVATAGGSTREIGKIKIAILRR